MNKNELIKSVSQKAMLTQKDCATCLRAVREVIEDSLSRGEAIVLSGFGRFFTRFRPQHVGIHPISRDIVMYPAKYVPSFTPSAILRQKFGQK